MQSTAMASAGPAEERMDLYELRDDLARRVHRRPATTEGIKDDYGLHSMMQQLCVPLAREAFASDTREVQPTGYESC